MSKPKNPKGREVDPITPENEDQWSVVFDDGEFFYVHNETGERMRMADEPTKQADKPKKPASGLAAWRKK